ncbi:protein SCO1/2 [Skermanella aerolata]|uniref:SCO family protein n=1 Tax=Skermanella aerolata TaxID=393310 RepID=UPI003D1A8180
MDRNRRQFVLYGGAVAGASLLTIGILSLPLGLEPSKSDSSYDRLPNTILQSQDGKSYRFYEDLVKDKIVAINFFYTKCRNVCRLTIQNLAETQRLLGGRVGRDIFMYSITLQPEIDTPETIKEYVKVYDVQPGWLFLRGSRADTDMLRRKFGLASSDPAIDADPNQHIGNIWFSNDATDRWAASTPFDSPEEIVETLLSVIPA